MNKLQKLITVGTSVLSLLLGANRANSQDWQSLTATHNLNNQSQVLRFQRGDENTYGFLDLYGKNAYFETTYGEFRARKNLGKGFGVGLEYNGGSGVKDLIRPHVSYTTEIGPLFLDVKFSPLESTLEQGQQLGLYGSTKLPYGFGVESWVDFDYKDGKITPLGEIEASKELSKDLDLVARAEKYPWQESAQYSLGAKLKF